MFLTDDNPVTVGTLRRKSFPPLMKPLSSPVGVHDSLAERQSQSGTFDVFPSFLHPVKRLEYERDLFSGILSPYRRWPHGHGNHHAGREWIWCPAGVYFVAFPIIFIKTLTRLSLSPVIGGSPSGISLSRTILSSQSGVISPMLHRRISAMLRIPRPVSGSLLHLAYIKPVLNQIFQIPNPPLTPFYDLVRLIAQAIPCYHLE